jgi:2-dehydropantoate 2-reductase
VVGSGAVGLYYGARLLEAGHDVRFVARTDLELLQRNGLKNSQKSSML